MTRSKSLIVSVALALLSASCGSAQSSEAEPSPAPQAAAQTPAVNGPPKAWKTMTMQERGKHMAMEVLPTMAPLFEAHNAEKYAGFDCASCHGPTAKARSFHMPNPDLYPLYPTGSAEQQAMVKAHPETVKFMFNKVVPTMQKLLGAPDYDATTKKGFSCFSCHPHAGDELDSDGDSDEHGDEHPDSDGDSDEHGDEHPDSDGDSDEHGDEHPDSHGDSDEHGDEHG